ncbi:unnamed protein product [Coffea canephora]|uniref:Uncharacterized protein n=1 Tax=Coffea canephora TaxID=49390 RepID=A0A068TQN8_COFCA|nr:unnamed protein product [Coffea canephora]
MLYFLFYLVHLFSSHTLVTRSHREAQITNPNQPLSSSSVRRFVIMNGDLSCEFSLWP